MMTVRPTMIITYDKEWRSSRKYIYLNNLETELGKLIKREKRYWGTPQVGVIYQSRLKVIAYTIKLDFYLNGKELDIEETFVVGNEWFGKDLRNNKFPDWGGVTYGYKTPRQALKGAKEFVKTTLEELGI